MAYANIADPDQTAIGGSSLIRADIVCHSPKYSEKELLKSKIQVKYLWHGMFEMLGFLP